MSLSRRVARLEALTRKAEPTRFVVVQIRRGETKEEANLREFGPAAAPTDATVIYITGGFDFAHLGPPPECRREPPPDLFDEDEPAV